MNLSSLIIKSLSRIKDARYNRKCNVGIRKGPRYLGIEKMIKMRNEREVRVLIRRELRCRNIGEEKLDTGQKEMYVFLRVKKDNWRHFIESYKIAREWYRKECKGKIKYKIWYDELDNIKDSMLGIFWEEKESILEEKIIERKDKKRRN